MWAVTFSSGINAWSLKKACAQLGVRLATTNHHPLLPISVVDESEIPEGAWLLFTEESSLLKYMECPGRYNFLPKSIPLAILDDKLAFADWLTSIGESPVPYSKKLDGANRFPVLLKPRRSWKADRKLPRGWICRSEEELEHAVGGLPRHDVALSDCFIQEWLGDDAGQYSVCGFFDYRAPHRNIMCVVERLSPYSVGPSSSALVITRNDPESLLPRTDCILASLRYTGPFELEFIRSGMNYYVLELNPRFWMQHGLFLSARNGLVKRYMGLDTQDDWSTSPPSQVIWGDSLFLLGSIVKLNFSPIHSLLRAMASNSSYRVLLFPSLPVAILALSKSILAAISRRLRRR